MNIRLRMNGEDHIWRAALVTIPVVPCHPRNNPERSGRGTRLCQLFTIAQEPVRTLSPVGSTTSKPETHSDIAPCFMLILVSPSKRALHRAEVCGGARG